MAPTTTTLRPVVPSFHVDYSGWSIAGGAGSVPAATNDNSDSTYVTNSFYGYNAYLQQVMGAYTCPANEHMLSVTPRVRVRRPTGSSGSVYVRLTRSPVSPSGVPETIKWRLTGDDYAAAPDFYPWRSVQVPLNSGATTTTTYTLPTVNVSAYIIKTFFAYVCFNAPMRSASIVEVYLDVVSVPLGAVTFSLPTSPVTDTTRPTIRSTVTDPEGEGVRQYRLLYDSATYSAPGFDPWLDQELAVPGWADTAVGAESFVGSTDLTNGTTYRCYAWPFYGVGYIAPVYQEFTVTLAQPAAPTVTTGWDPAETRAIVTVEGHANMLTAQQASMEATGTAGFTVGTNCSLARTTAQAKSGAASLQVTATAAATFNVRVAASGTYTDWQRVEEARLYTFTAAVRAAVTGRGVTLGIAWYDSGGGLLATTTSASTNDATGSWTVLSVSGTAPGSAFYAVPIVTWATAAASEVHYVDELALYPGVAASSANLLPDDLSTFEAGATSLQPVFGSATITISSVRAQHGTKSVLASWGNGAGGNVAGANFGGLTIGQTYTLTAYVWVVSGADVYLGQWFGPYPTVTSIPAGTLEHTTTTGAWQRLGYTFVATATSHNMGLFLIGSASHVGESAHIDSLQLEAGSVATAFSVPAPVWSVGGTSDQELVVERSDDSGATWAPVRPNVGAALGDYGGLAVDLWTQDSVIYDYEAPRGVTVLYRALERTMLNGQTLPSSPSANASLDTLNDGAWWIKAPLDPTLNLGGPGVLRVRRGSLQFQLTEDVGTFRPLGRRLAVVVAGDLGGEDGSLELTSLGTAEWAQLLPLLTHQSSLLLQDPDGTQKYVRINADREWSRSAGAAALRKVDVPYVETDAP